MDINNAYVRDAILYYTIQQYFICNDKKTSQFIAQLDHFKYRSGLIIKKTIRYAYGPKKLSEMVRKKTPMI